MPIDIASGAVRLDCNDIVIPGKVDLGWNRLYSTKVLGGPNVGLGCGWTGRYFATLTRTPEGYAYRSPHGDEELFADPDHSVEQGGVVRELGTYQELFKLGRRYVVQTWDVESGAVQRFCFLADQAREVLRLTSIEDVTGHALDIVWNSLQQITEIRQRLERRALVVAYTDTGLVDSIVFQPPSGEQEPLVRYEYDSGGRLTAAYNAVELADRYEYDVQGRIQREILKDGGVFLYSYDARNRCIRTSGLDRYAEKRLRFYDATRFTEVSDSYGRTFRYQYLPSGQVIREINPLGNEKSTDYDEHGRIIASTDGTGACTRYSYDEQGNRSSIVDALGNTYLFTYNEHHLPRSMTNPLGLVWWRGYDAENRLIGVQDLLGHQWRLRYDPDGNVAEITNPLGATRGQEYSKGILRAVSDWEGNVTRFEHDGFGRVLQRTGPLGATTRFRYDRLGNPIEAVLPDRSVLQAAYDAIGNLTRFSDANGHTTRFRYGPCRQLMQRTDAVGGVIRYVWGSEPGWLEQVVNEKGEAYTFVRDPAGRIIQERSFDGSERHYRHDAAGYAVAYTNGNGETVEIQRDALHRIVGQSLPDGESIAFGFDPVGNLLSASNGAITVAFERDALGRILKETQGDHWVGSTYDALGNLIGTTTSAGHAAMYRVNPNGLLSGFTVASGDGQQFQRDAYGRETGRQMSSGIALTQRYDELGRLLEQQVAPGRFGSGGSSVIPQGQSLIDRTYAYDLNSSLLSMVDSHAGRIDYVHDPADRLLQAMRAEGRGETFEYDGAGNLTRLQSNDERGSTQQDMLHGPGNRLLQCGNVRFEYDAAGRCTRKIEASDGDTPRVWSFEWNALDRLQAITRPDGQVWRYKYDALARRVEKTGPDKTVQYVWDKDVVVHELEDQHTATWIFESDSFAPLATIQREKLYCVINDHLGTPREFIDPDGRVLRLSAQGAWGERAGSHVSADLMCPLRFQGQWWDEESGLHYNRFRYYDPAIGRYLSPDPLSLEGGRNFYVYSQNPTKRVDPLGLIPVRPTDLSGGPHAPDRSMNQMMSRAADTGTPQGQWLSQEAAVRAASQYDPARGGVQVVPIHPGDGQVVHHPVMSYPPQPGERPVMHDGIPMSRGGPLVVPATRAILIPSGGEIHTFPIDETHPQHGPSASGCGGGG